LLGQDSFLPGGFGGDLDVQVEVILERIKHR
jgi:hypothetical protein